MARTAEGELLTRGHRALQLRVRAQALRDLQRLWAAVDPLDLSATIGPFTTAATIAVRARRRDSAAAASRYFRDFRRVEGIAGATTVTASEQPAAGVLGGMLRGAGLAGIVRARRAGFSPQAAASAGFVRVTGAASSLVLGGGRGLLVDAIQSDRAALGWQRVTSGSACAFCRMVASQGAIFKSDETASFQAHDHCACTAEPFYDGSRPLAENERYREQWQQATAGLSGRDALNAFRRHLEAAA